MHSIALPSSPAFQTISSFIASPTPCCPFLPLTMLQSPQKKTRYPDAEISNVSFPFRLLQSDDVTTLGSTGSQQGVDVPDTVNAVDRYCANVERAERELLQPRPRPGGLVFLAGGLPLRPLPPSLFSSKCPPPFTQFQAFSTQVLAFVLPTCWVWHSDHASTSPSSTRLLTRVCPPSIPPPLASGPTFSAAACPNFATAGTIAAGNVFDLLGCITAGRCCWQACTVSIDEFAHQSMS